LKGGSKSSNVLAVEHLAKYTEVIIHICFNITSWYSWEKENWWNFCS